MADLVDRTRCFAIAHDWDIIPNRRRPPFGEMETLRCTGCGLIREDIYDRYGGLQNRNYIKPPGYDDVPKQTRAEWRVKFLKETRAQRRPLRSVS